ncbi:unnamed protein product [Amoebophrya sp. A25]|nr:unnamed protein product [Amoebophrya sp. A25]|eukprot:GSA25T00014662001.1
MSCFVVCLGQGRMPVIIVYGVPEEGGKKTTIFDGRRFFEAEYYKINRAAHERKKKKRKSQGSSAADVAEGLPSGASSSDPKPEGDGSGATGASEEHPDESDHDEKPLLQQDVWPKEELSIIPADAHLSSDDDGSVKGGKGKADGAATAAEKGSADSTHADLPSSSAAPEGEAEPKADIYISDVVIETSDGPRVKRDSTGVGTSATGDMHHPDPPSSGHEN